MSSAVKVDTINGARGLLSTDSRVDPIVPGLEGITLFPHQCTVLHRLLGIVETNRVETTTGVVVSTNSALLSLDLGGGKTFIALALILLRGAEGPRVLPGTLGTPHSMRIMHRIVGDYAMLQPALIVAAPQVVEQWKAVIKRHTKLEVFVVSSYYDLKEFRKLVRNHEINRYNIVLAKAGLVAGTDLEIPGESADVNIRNMISAIVAYTENRVWSWFMVDDFDTAELAGVRAPNALFTLYISATCNNKEAMAKDKPLERTWKRTQGTDPMLWLKKMRPEIMHSIYDPHLMGPLSVRVSTETLAKMQREGQYELPAYITHTVVVHTTDGKIIELIAAMGGNETVVHALNGEAVATAAASLNIKARGAADVLSKLLDTKRDHYETLVRRFAIMKILLEGSNVAPYVFPAVMEYLYEHPNVDGYNETQIASIIKRLRKLDPQVEVKNIHEAAKNLYEHKGNAATAECFKHVYNELVMAYRTKAHAKNLSDLWYTPDLEAAIQLEMVEVDKERTTISKALDGLVANFKMQCCGVCKSPYEKDKPLMINKCCGALNCVDCGIKCNRFNVRYDHKTTKKAFLGNCAACGRRVDPAKDMIFVDNVGSLDIIMQGAIFTEEEIAPAHVDTEPSMNDTLEMRIEKLESPKCRVVIRLLHDMPVDSTIRDRHYEVVIKGGDFREAPPGTPKKVLIFADLDESTSKVTAALHTFGIGYDIVGGTPDNIARVLREFETNPAKTALVVNSTRNSSGMDLSFVTDIIYFHDIPDKRRLSQSVARAQRFGKHRKYSLKIWFIINDSENITMVGDN